MALRHSMAAALLAAGFAGTAVPALAQVSSGATLGNLGYSLFDLDLTDAHTPSLLFSIPDGLVPASSGSREGYAQIHYSERGDRHELSRWSTTSTNATSRFTSYTSPYLAAQVSLDGRGGTGMGQSLSRAVEVIEAGGLRVQATPYSWTDAIYFTLAPGTRVTFTATLAAWATIALADTHHGHAEVLGSLSVRNLLDPNNDHADDGRAFFAGTRSGAPASFDEYTLLSVSYDNHGTSPVYAYAGMNLQGASHTIPASVSPVPEPSSLAMLLAGSVLLPLAARRRRG